LGEIIGLIGILLGIVAGLYLGALLALNSKSDIVVEMYFILKDVIGPISAMGGALYYSATKKDPVPPSKVYVLIQV
jgi:ABC-type antimicrobial peptide transport system permease subunit